MAGLRASTVVAREVPRRTMIPASEIWQRVLSVVVAESLNAAFRALTAVLAAWMVVLRTTKMRYLEPRRRYLRPLCAP